METGRGLRLIGLSATSVCVCRGFGAPGTIITVALGAPSSPSSEAGAVGLPSAVRESEPVAWQRAQRGVSGQRRRERNPVRWWQRCGSSTRGTGWVHALLHHAHERVCRWVAGGEALSPGETGIATAGNEGGEGRRCGGTTSGTLERAIAVDQPPVTQRFVHLRRLEVEAQLL
jgi:hypothetical protein